MNSDILLSAVTVMTAIKAGDAEKIANFAGGIGYSEMQSA